MHAHNRTILASLGFADKDKGNPKHDWACQYLAQDEVMLKIISSLRSGLEYARDSGVAMKVQGFPELRTYLEFVLSKGEGQYKTTIGFLDLLCDFEITYKGDYRRELALLAEIQAAGGVVTDRRYGSGLDIAAVNNHQRPAGPIDFTAAEARRLEREALTAKLVAEFGPRLQSNYGIFRELIPYSEARELWLERAETQTESKFWRRLAIEVKIDPVPVGDLLRQLKLYREHLLPVLEYGGAPSKPLLAVVTAYPMPQEDAATLQSERITHFKLGADFDAYCKRRQQTQKTGPSDSLEV